MKLKDFFNKYKIVAFIIYALVLSLLLLIFSSFWVKLIFILPLLVLGAFILFDIFPKRREGQLTAVKVDGNGEIQITSWAIVRAVRNVCKLVEDIRYDSCIAANGKNGLIIRLSIKIVNAKLLEVSELTRELVKDVVENEMDIKIEKVDIVVVNTVNEMELQKVTKEGSSKRVERKAVYGENSPSYLLSFGLREKVFSVPSDYIEEEIEEGAETDEKDDKANGEE